METHGWRLSRTQKRKPEHMGDRRYNITGLEALGLSTPGCSLLVSIPGGSDRSREPTPRGEYRFRPLFEPFERAVPQLRSPFELSADQ